MNQNGVKFNYWGSLYLNFFVPCIHSTHIPFSLISESKNQSFFYKPNFFLFQEPRRRSRWHMRGLSIPSFVRSRSTDSQDGETTGRAKERIPAKFSFWKRKSANITDYDPTYRVIYLGNVLTGWAKGERCIHFQSFSFVY